jgi:Zn-dependent protease
VGTTLILLFGFGWGKPVQVNPLKFRRPRRDEVLVSLAGAVANLVTAVLFGLLLRFRVVPAPYRELVFFIVALNVVLALFNLIPVYPLDGSHVLVGLFPYRQAYKINLFYQRWGMIPLLILFLALSFLPLLQVLLGFVLRLILGGGMGG